MKYDVEKDIAEYIKLEFDKEHAPNWHVIVGNSLNCNFIGRNFGSYVTHQEHNFIYYFFICVLCYVILVAISVMSF